MKKFTGSIVALAAVMLAAPAFAQTEPTYAETSAASGVVADEYFDAYTHFAWDRIEPLLAETAYFQDHTARLVFGGPKAEGKAAMMKLFREGYSSISKVDYKGMRVLHSGDYGIFEGELIWTVDINGLDVASVTPIVTIIQVIDGKVVEHVDYVDYAPFVTSLKAAREAAQKK